MKDKVFKTTGIVIFLLATIFSINISQTNKNGDNRIDLKELITNASAKCYDLEGHYCTTPVGGPNECDWTSEWSNCGAEEQL